MSVYDGLSVCLSMCLSVCVAVCVTQHVSCVEFFTDAQLPSKLDKLMDERQQLLRMNDVIKQL